ncbi:MAG: beta-N-acetylglucosaminidase domain-containing protein [Halioglobus sp.]
MREPDSTVDTPVPAPFLTGVIEGFYGRGWPEQLRLDYASYISALGLTSYLYCPKEDPFLRKRWQEDWPEAEWEQLQTMARTYASLGVLFGVGLSPFALYQSYGTAERATLKRKIERLNQLNLPLLAVLFDDMPGDMPELASRQVAIMDDIASWSSAGRLLMCPTYYSYDPVLETFFGTMPRGYWEELGKGLSTRVAVFWTGNRVCSESVCAADLAGINESLSRNVVLWDNYPVNDGAVRSKHLYLEPLPQRETLSSAVLSGHFCNPMNQGALSLPALTGLAVLYGAKQQATLNQWLIDTLGSSLWHQLQSDQQEFREVGLDGMGEHRCEVLASKYAALEGPAAMETAGWLRGEYTFDPACLTD